MTSIRASSTGLKIVSFNVVPLAYQLIRGWAQENGHRLVLVVTSPGPRTQRDAGYREIVANSPPEPDILITTHPKQLPSMIGSLEPDLIIAATFPYLIPEAVIETARLGGINVHATPLPRYRGPNPPRMIYDGHPTVGATVHRIAPDFDTGHILSRQERALPEDLTVEGVWAIWREVIISTFHEGVQRAINGEQGIAQDHTEASYAAAFTDAEHVLDWSLPVQTLLHRSVALNLFGPTAQIDIEGNRRLVKRLAIVSDVSGGPPAGTILEQREGSAVVTVIDGAVRLEFGLPS